MKIVQAQQWMPGEDNVVIFTGNDRALINSLMRVFKDKVRESVWQHEAGSVINASNGGNVYGDAGIFDDNIQNTVDGRDVKKMIILEDVKIPQIKDILNNSVFGEMKKRYVIALDANSVSSGLQSLSNGSDLMKEAVVVICDAIYKTEEFAKRWSEYYNREYVAELSRYAWNLDILRHLWRLMDDGLGLQECKEIMKGYERNNKDEVKEHYAWFLQNLYLKKRDV